MKEKEIVEAIRDFFGDTSRAAPETLDGLRHIRDEIEMLILAVESDLAKADAL